MKKIYLQTVEAFPWYESEGVHARGILFGPDNTLFRGKEILRYFSGIESIKDFEEKVQYANGHFSVICQVEDQIFAAVDPNRIFPLFYARCDSNWLIADDPYQLSQLCSFNVMNTLADIEFVATGYVTGNETLIEGVSQIQAGEILRFKDDEPNSRIYHSYRNHTPLSDDYEDLKLQGIDVITEAFERFIASLDGRHVVLPLSGGYDSRLVAYMLRKSGYENVTCLTYGRKGSKEVDISENVAKKLRYKWIFVEYNKELIHNFVDDEVFNLYYSYSGKLTSMFYMQEYFAVKYLKDNKLVPEDSIFTPGLYGDFLAGGMLNKHGNLSLKESVEQLSERISRVKYCYKQPPKNYNDLITDRIEKNIESRFRIETDLAYTIHEDWDYKERYAKLIANSVNIYSFFGYEFRLPYCDTRLVDFFRQLPLHAKVNKYLYDDILTNTFFAPAEINFKKELQPAEHEIRRWKYKNRIKPYLPEDFKQLFITRKDDLFYNEITRYLRNDMAKRGVKIRIRGNSYNSLIIQWYSAKVKEFFAISKEL